ncbi:hypothetical protein ABIC83_002917 [Roseateles asaccharophilus]|uniref:condensin complex protein MksE n=1 Tax=Roseateles asaccharophilus TaxID=582607 RepID=UPI00383579EC
MNARLLKLLMEGKYICPIAYNPEYRILEDEAVREDVNVWLASINMRLARLPGDGAFFMAYETVPESAITQLKGELLRFRDEYGDAIRMLDLIRQCKAENATCSPGERVQLAELVMAVNESTTLSAQLRSLVGVIHSSGARISDSENLRKLLEHLAKDGYLIVADKVSESYQMTGKIDQLYAVMSYLDDHNAIEIREAADQLDLVESDAVDAGGADVPGLIGSSV